MRARDWRRQAGIMNVTLCVRTGDGGTIVAISGEVDVCTEAPLQQALLWIIRERGARLMLDVSGVSFMDCAGLRALLATQRRAEMRGGCMRLIATSAAVRRIIELTGTHEALAPERSTTARSVRFLKGTDRMRCAGRSVCPPSGRWRTRHSVVLNANAHDAGPAT
jgi:anti-anti-sigma factor